LYQIDNEVENGRTWYWARLFVVRVRSTFANSFHKATLFGRRHGFGWTAARAINGETGELRFRQKKKQISSLLAVAESEGSVHGLAAGGSMQALQISP
jgi:hypothetical protein